MTREENLGTTEENEARPFFRHPKTSSLNAAVLMAHFSRDWFARLSVEPRV